MTRKGSKPDSSQISDTCSRNPKPSRQKLGLSSHPSSLTVSESSVSMFAMVDRLHPRNQSHPAYLHLLEHRFPRFLVTSIGYGQTLVLSSIVYEV